jgi:hypothetical protein
VLASSPPSSSPADRADLGVGVVFCLVAGGGAGLPALEGPAGGRPAGERRGGGAEGAGKGGGAGGVGLRSRCAI